MQRTLDRSAAWATFWRRVQPRLRTHGLAGVLAVAAILAISLYSAYAIGRVVASNSPSVAFTLGTVDRNITYCNSQTLDLYIPNAVANRPFPLVMYVHGGGMTSGDKANINPVLLSALASGGYAVASVDYRLAPQFTFPAQLEDVKCAIRYMRAKSQTYGLNGSEIFAFGTSVGGQLVVLAALTGPDSPFDVGPFLNQPSKVSAVADFFGPANLTEEASGFSPTGDMRVFGTHYKATDLVRASPAHYVVANAPPILIVQGVNDAKVRESQATELYDALTASGDEAQLVLVNNMGHMFVQVGATPIDPSLWQLGQDMVSFFGKYRQGD